MANTNNVSEMLAAILNSQQQVMNSQQQVQETVAALASRVAILEDNKLGVLVTNTADEAKAGADGQDAHGSEPVIKEHTENHDAFDTGTTTAVNAEAGGPGQDASRPTKTTAINEPKQKKRIAPQPVPSRNDQNDENIAPSVAQLFEIETRQQRSIFSSSSTIPMTGKGQEIS